MHLQTKLTTTLILAILMSLIFIQPALAQTDEEPPIVRAILFYSPTCPHCHQVIQEDLPPLIEKFGEQLLIVGINTQSIEGQEIYQAMVEYFQLPDERLGVPALVVGETHLLGSGEIPSLFPGIIEQGLQEGGIDWPPIPGFVEVYTASVTQATAQAEGDSAQPAESEISEQAAMQTETPLVTEPTSTPETFAQAEPTPMEMALPDTDIFDTQDQTMIEMFKRDPIGNSASVVVLIGMIFCLVGVWLRLKRPTKVPNEWGRWAIPLLSLVGLVVAGYLSYVEVTQSKAVCGPVGDCNSVQQSAYARLFGVLPIGVLGLLGYIAILVAWGFQYYGPERWRASAAQAVWGSALFGTLFSIYLTFLEPFVIGATCAWCLSSAILITLILWVATNPLRNPAP